MTQTVLGKKKNSFSKTSACQVRNHLTDSKWNSSIKGTSRHEQIKCPACWLFINACMHESVCLAS